MADTPEEIYEAEMANAPELPERYQGLSHEDILDIPLEHTTEEETRRIAGWLVARREAAKKAHKAQEE